VQSVVGWEQRGVVTSANMFARTVGSAVGAAMLGAIANAAMLARLREPPAGATGRVPADLDAATSLLDRSGTPEVVSRFVRDALGGALHQVFLGLVVVAALMTLAIAVMPRRARTLDGREVVTRT
jgi:hypothetical protein